MDDMAQHGSISEAMPEEPTAPKDAWLCPDAGPYPAGAPLITRAPEEGSGLEYNEDELVSLWTRVYRLFLRLDYLQEDQVVFPPADTGRHAGLRATLQRFNMGDGVFSLLERLPYVTDEAEGVMFFPEGLVLDYLSGDESVTETCRDPHIGNQLSMGREEPSPDYLYPDDVALLTPYESNGLVWILDTKTNAIRTLWDACNYEDRVVPDDFVEEQPREKRHYRNWPAFHAPFVLKRYIRDLHHLRFLPSNEVVLDTNTDLEGALMSEALRTRYGWPDNFRAEAWKQDHARVEIAAGDMAEALRDGRYGMDEDIIRRWRRDNGTVPQLQLDGEGTDDE